MGWWEESTQPFPALIKDFCFLPAELCAGMRAGKRSFNPPGTTFPGARPSHPSPKRKGGWDGGWGSMRV